MEKIKLISSQIISEISAVKNVSVSIEANSVRLSAHNLPRSIKGLHKKIIKGFMWVNIILISIVKFKNPLVAFQKVKLLSKLKDTYRGQHQLLKYALAGSRYYFSYNAPGWPSESFNRYISHQLLQFTKHKGSSLHTLIFGITKKCGFKCEHCFEWENLNKPETLTKENLIQIIKDFRQVGVSQVQFTGGEPLNRLEDINEILPQFSGIDFWIYTSGYHLTCQKASQLKKAGLTGVTISLDHWISDLHDEFRGRKGSYAQVVKAAENIVNNKLTLCLSLCATNDFIAKENLYNYIELAKKLNASFVQVLEPKAVGHYAGKEVSLSEEKIDLLESFYKNVNFNPKFIKYPSVVYHGFYSRKVGCSGAGKDYLYVDMDGYAHDCPFCQKKIFNVLNGDIKKQVEMMRTSGCSVFNSCK